MLMHVEDERAKRLAQAEMEAVVKAALGSQGVMKIGFRTGHLNEEIRSNGAGDLWCAFSDDENAKIPRRWNGFGIFDDTHNMQVITVEINVPLKSNGATVAGFFARDSRTDEVYLMHDGGIGGGKKGVGRDAFLAWSGLESVEVERSGKDVRDAILIGRVDANDLPYRIERYVRTVRAFKDAVRQGEIDKPAMRRRIEEWKTYRRENSGRRLGTRRSEIDYVSYHGDVVDALKREREETRAPEERVLNNPLIDLYVRSHKAMSEIYEVKTSLTRQSIYTGIGQLLVHSDGEVGDIRRVLVLPEGYIPNDLARCIRRQKLSLRRFKLVGSGRNRKAVLL